MTKPRIAKSEAPPAEPANQLALPIGPRVVEVLALSVQRADGSQAVPRDALHTIAKI